MSICSHFKTETGMESRAFSNHVRWCEKNPNSTRNKKKICNFCNNYFDTSVIKKHIESCKLNPKNIRNCKECKNIIESRDCIDFCSQSCAASFNNKADPNRKRMQKGYKFKNIERNCIECKQTFI